MDSNEIKAMFQDHWFWGMIPLACLVWYSTITIYVTIKGFGDIRKMLTVLSKSKEC
jgi:hypothetical protein